MPSATVHSRCLYQPPFLLTDQNGRIYDSAMFRLLQFGLATLILLTRFVPAYAQSGTLEGAVEDPSGGPIPKAVISATRQGVARDCPTDARGRFRLEDLPAGTYTLLVRADGFAERAAMIVIPPGGRRVLNVTLPLANVREDVVVGAQRLSDASALESRLPGSFESLDRATLDSTHPPTTNEALRKMSGLNVRDEEGFGLRPNIGVRGLNPTRSSKVLLLEDGIPLAFAPYGDNASYYHPPIDRFDGIEVLKGAGQIAYGPSTVGGVINYITPPPPVRPTGVANLVVGSRAFLNAGATFGATRGRFGFLIDGLRKNGDGSRANTHSDLNDLNLKIMAVMNPRHVVTIKTNYYGERSQVTYSGLRQDEYVANPRQNPFLNDAFAGDRVGLSTSYNASLGERVLLSSSAYFSRFARDWWRQSSNSGQRPNHSGDPTCAGMANLLTTCGNEGRLRRYTTASVESRLRLTTGIGVADMGARLHEEVQNRRQENGTAPTARSGVLVEHNERLADAVSAFVQHRFAFGRTTVTPGVRVEHMRFSRTNRLGDSGRGLTGRANLTQAVPGIGATFAVWNDALLFAGVHRGFAPPRVEDVISNTGGLIDLDAERSWNAEVGIRARPLSALRLDATWFRMDYENQIVPASLAGGVGATLTNGGATLHQGFELSGRIEALPVRQTAQRASLRVAYTFLPEARFIGTRFSSIAGFGTMSVSGNRLPYAPEHLVTASVGYATGRRTDAFVEIVAASRQFSDDLNTIAPSADGQRGIIPGWVTWNAGLNVRPWTARVTVFAAVYNVLDRTFIIDRSRGILPGPPRRVQVGSRIAF